MEEKGGAVGGDRIPVHGLITKGGGIVADRITQSCK